MTDLKKLQRDIDTLKDSIMLNRMNLHQRSQEELLEILQHTGWCLTELEELKRELERLTKRASGAR